MSSLESPCLNLSVARLVAAEVEHFAIWVSRAPYPAGYLHHDCIWPETLTKTWYAWQEMFSPLSLSGMKLPAAQAQLVLEPTVVVLSSPLSQTTSYGGRLMQQLGIQLWQWLFEGPIQSSLDHSQGIAIGQNQPLRLRLEVRDPELMILPWEIMQPQAGKQAISLSQQLLFSRTTSDVATLRPLKTEQALSILLVLGQDSSSQNSTASKLKLQQEAEAIAKILEISGYVSSNGTGTLVPCQVDTLVMPTPADLIGHLETGNYNMFFYAGHGVPAPDGGLLFLRPDVTMNGTELAQVLTRCQVTLAVFNACWGAQSARHNNQPIARSSLAEVLLHHGVPAVLAMRDAIADEEAISFIKAFARALAERMPIDRAVAVARQQLLTLYKFNQPAWTLPVLYMHPDFNGQLLQPLTEGITELPENSLTWIGRERAAFVRLLGSITKVWPIRGGLMRVGRQQENDLVICEKWVSQKHAEIICRDERMDINAPPKYFLRDFSRFGTLILGASGWQKIHHQEFPLQSGMQLKFGSSQGQIWEFIIEA